jgi:competence protein ComEA
MWAWAGVALLVCVAVAVLVTQRREPSRPRQAPGISAPTTTPLPRGAAAPMPNLANGVDLNTAPLSQLKTLPGMTDDYARRIMEGRPFHDRSELVRAGIPQEVFNRMSPPAYLKFDLPGGIPPR